jgi:hypothetical protein
MLLNQKIKLLKILYLRSHEIFPPFSIAFLLASIRAGYPQRTAFQSANKR